MENLNLEIILEILSWLPVDSVFRCTQVCKTWRTLLRLNKTYFADMHYRHQLQLLNQLDDDHQKYNSHSNINIDVAAKVGAGLLLLVMETIDDGNNRLFNSISKLHYGEFYDDDEQYSYKKLIISRIERIPHYDDINADEAVSCNGLICFFVTYPTYDPIYIYNPITGEYVELPRLQGEFSVNYCVVSGFGYHPSTNKYKVVQIMYHHCFFKKNKPSGQLVHVFVYTLGDGSGWRYKGEIPYGLHQVGPGIPINGALHWIADDDWKIVTFDLADEKFSSLPPPLCVRSHDSWDLYELQEMGRCLCFVRRNVQHESMDIWSLNKKKKNDSYGTKEQKDHSLSWTKEFSISWKGLYKNEGKRFIRFALTKSASHQYSSN
ncbi:F-box domain [Macleaya cordata]|uniref:F-box domain n=1 Tax=Macleaya cordata TaxID=56857 RepID=A0A200Q1D5_MACCD|nr:F-box domain [Macleaya cordata]